MNGGSNPVRHVIIALSLSAVLFIIAGDQWSRNVGMIRPVRLVQKGER